MIISNRLGFSSQQHKRNLKKIHQEATKGEKRGHINKPPTLNPRVHVSGEGKQSTIVDLNEGGNSVVLSSINALVGYNLFLNFTA